MNVVKYERTPQKPPTGPSKSTNTRGGVMGKREREAWKHYQGYTRMQLHQVAEQYPLRSAEVADLYGVPRTTVTSWAKQGLMGEDEVGRALFILPSKRTHGGDKTAQTGPEFGTPRPAVRFSPRDVLIFADRVNLEVFDFLLGDYYRDMFELARADLKAHPAPTGFADPTRVGDYITGKHANIQRDHELRVAQGNVQRTIAAAPRQGIAHRDDGSLIPIITEDEFAALVGYNTNWVRTLRRRGQVNPDLLVVTDRDRLLGTRGRTTQLFYDGDLVARAISGDETIHLFLPRPTQPERRPPTPKKPKVKHVKPQQNTGAAWQ